MQIGERVEPREARGVLVERASHVRTRPPADETHAGRTAADELADRRVVREADVRAVLARAAVAGAHEVARHQSPRVRAGSIGSGTGRGEAGASHELVRLLDGDDGHSARSLVREVITAARRRRPHALLLQLESARAAGGLLSTGDRGHRRRVARSIAFGGRLIDVFTARKQVAPPEFDAIDIRVRDVAQVEVLVYTQR